MTVYRLAGLFEYLEIEGPDLLLRGYGQRAFEVLLRELVQVQEGCALILDFSGVSVMDTSFADESILELALGLVSGKWGNRFLLLRGPSSATIDNLEGTIARRKAKIALAVLADDKIWTVGHLEPNLKEAWAIAAKSGQLTARDLADHLGLEINTASMRLRKLFDLRLLARIEQSTASGREYVYMAPC